MKRKLLIIVLAILAVGAALAVYFIRRGPDMSAYERFRQPTLLSMPSQHMLVVEAIGVPDAVSGDAIGQLFKIYFKLDGVPKGPGMPAPRARWPINNDTPREKWLGRFGLPVPDSVTALPKVDLKPGLTAKIDNWTYGEVAQVLYVGPYSEETETIERLRNFIKDKGYEIAGEHEEEYLVGPTMLGKGNPNKYYTLIRYAVRPVQAPGRDSQ